jgi:hypothetical protein
MDPIDLAKESDTWCMAFSLNYGLWSHFFVALRCLLSSVTYIIRAWDCSRYVFCSVVICEMLCFCNFHV